MKKLIAIVLTLMLALGAVSVLAESDTVEFNWSDFESAVSEINAAFVSFDDIGLKMWVPSVLESYELDEESAEAGIIALFATADGSAAFTVQYALGNDATLEDFEAALAAEGASGFQNVIINGIDGVGFDYAEDDGTCVLFTTDAGNFVIFTFAPMSDEEFAATVVIMISSIQAE